MKKFESVEVTQGNTTGKAGISSLPFRGGFYKSGNDGDFGVAFTPHGEPSLRTYKNSKHSKKNLMKKMKKFKQFVKENVETADEVEVIDFQFYDPFDGNMRIRINGKIKPEHFKVYDYGNIGFDGFYSEEIYNKLVNIVYSYLKDGIVKDNVEQYYEDILDDIQDSYNELTEDACATMGNSGGMGAVASAQPSSTPGDVAGSTPGSGDVGSKVLGPYAKSPARWFNEKKKKRKKKIIGKL